MHRQDAYSKESELTNLAKRELANGLDKDTIYKLRLQCFSRGATGILGVARAFRVMDRDGSRTLNLEEFKKGFNAMGMDIDNADINEIFDRFDTDGNGTIDMTEFLNKLRPPMNAARVVSLDRAFDKLDKNKEGQITIHELKHVYSVNDHPLYENGQMTEDEIIQEFLKNFDAGAPNPDGVITKEDFFNYFATVSASIDNDTYFDLVIRHAFKI